MAIKTNIKCFVFNPYLGCRLASPPGGREEHPVVNCRKAFLSSPVIDTKTLTNLEQGEIVNCPKL